MLYSAGNNAGDQTVSLTNGYVIPTNLGFGLGAYLSSTLNIGVGMTELPDLNKWYHIVATRSNTEMKLYINGILYKKYVSSSANAFYNTPVNAYFGRRSNSIPNTNDFQNFIGTLDDISIYNRVLTDAEALKLYNDGLVCSPPPKPSASDVKRCGGGIVTLIASGGMNYRWYDAVSGGNLLFTGSAFPVNVTATATYYVSNLTLYGESERIPVKVTIYPAVSVQCQFAKSVTMGIDTIYKAEVTGGQSPYSYSWDFGDGTKFTTSQNSVNHAFKNEGIYPITVLVTDANGCQNTCWVQVTTNVKPPVITHSFRCGTGEIQLVASGGLNFHWYDSPTNGNLLFTGNSYTPNISSNTTFYVSAFSQLTESERVPIKVTIFPAITLQCNFAKSVTLGIDTTYQIQVIGGQSPYTYSWNFGDSTKLVSSHNSLNHTFKDEGIFNVTVIVTDANGCQDTCSSKVESLFTLFIPNLFTPNEDKSNEIFTIYDKSGSFYMGNKPFNMEIYNRWGTRIANISDPKKGWTGENCSTGIYYFRILLGTQEYKGWVSLMR